MREGTAKTPSADAEGRIRLRDPGMGMYEESAPTLDCGQPHGVAHAVAFTTRGRDDGLSVESQDELAYALKNPGAGGRSNDRMVAHVVAPPLTATNDPSRSPQSAEVTAQVEAVLRATYPEVAEVCGTLADSKGAGGLNGQDAHTGRIFPVVAHAVHENQRAEVTLSPVVGTLKCAGGKPGQGYPTVLAEGAAVPSAVPYDLFQVTAPINRQNRDESSPCHTLARDNAAHAAVVLPPAVHFDVYNHKTTGDVAGIVREQHGTNMNAVLQPSMHVRRLTEYDTLQQGGIDYANAEEAGSREVLRALRDALGEEAFGEWGLGVLASFLPQEVLRKAVHGLGLRCPTIEEFGLVNYASSREEARTEWAVRQVRSFTSDGRTPPGWEPHEQRPIELRAYLSKLSQPGASAAGVMSDLWSACEGAGVLRQALSAVQEMGRPARREAQPAPTALSVRRLVPVECEFLQGFPRNWTLIPWKGKPPEQCPDGPRYRALGNSMAVPVIRWIGVKLAERIALASSYPAH